MSDLNLKKINDEVTSMVKDAQKFLSNAATLTGDKAEGARARGIQLLNAAVSKAHHAQATASKQLTKSPDDFLKENAWWAMSVAAGAGLLLGAMLIRKQ